MSYINKLFFSKLQKKVFYSHGSIWDTFIKKIFITNTWIKLEHFYEKNFLANRKLNSMNTCTLL